MELRPVARGRHGYGRHGHDRVPDDPGRDGTYGTGDCGLEADRVHICIRHVGRDDDRHDGALCLANDPHVRPCG